MKELYNYTANVTRVVDGDTFDATVDMGMKVYHRARIRIVGVNCPERGKDGFDEAKEFAFNLLDLRQVFLDSIGYDSFGRWLCYVWSVDQTPWYRDWSFADRLIREGHGVVYKKGKK